MRSINVRGIPMKALLAFASQPRQVTTVIGLAMILAAGVGVATKVLTLAQAGTLASGGFVAVTMRDNAAVQAAALNEAKTVFLAGAAGGKDDAASAAQVGARAIEAAEKSGSGKASL
jgi:hypothetical protein